MTKKERSLVTSFDEFNLFMSIFSHNIRYILSKDYRQKSQNIDKKILTSHDFDIQVGIIFSKLRNITHKKKHAYQFIDEVAMKLTEFKTKENYYNFEIKLYKNSWEFKKKLKIKVTYNSGKINNYSFYILYCAKDGWNIDRNFKL